MTMENYLPKKTNWRRVIVGEKIPQRNLITDVDNKIFAIKLFMKMTLTCRISPRSNVNMAIESTNISYLVTIIMFALCITIYQIFAIEMSIIL